MNIGLVLLAWGVIDQDQLNRAVAHQVVHPEKKLGEIVVEKGFCTSEEVQMCLAKQELLRRGNATVPDVERLADFLVEQNEQAVAKLHKPKGGT